ncbi:hypothetical protein L3X38_015998 [Prunus dulcis]|uniref:Uncharacterized protein n=1 Tax=Prunus dulcis TaxID=3755 RepID=A0AAD4Z8D7_PRUDU|nr:hypothetical protein L3X38_015998 [Prunus dulcis]
MSTGITDTLVALYTSGYVAFLLFPLTLMTKPPSTSGQPTTGGSINRAGFGFRFTILAMADSNLTILTQRHFGPKAKLERIKDTGHYGWARYGITLDEGYPDVNPE